MVVGAVAGTLPLIFTLPGLCEFYYATLQKLPRRDLGLVRMSAFSMVLVPFSVSLRAFGEGRAAFLKKPEVILTGQAVYLGVVTSVAFFCLYTPGTPQHERLASLVWPGAS